MKHKKLRNALDSIFELAKEYAQGDRFDLENYQGFVDIIEEEIEKLEKNKELEK